MRDLWNLLGFLQLEVWIGVLVGKKGGEGEDVGSKGGRCDEEMHQKSECYT
jgi:hypothetical protein